MVSCPSCDGGLRQRNDGDWFCPHCRLTYTLVERKYWKHISQGGASFHDSGNGGKDEM